MGTIKDLRTFVKNFIYAHIIVPYRYYLFSKKIDIRDGIETISCIIKHNLSISRFGDYEYMSLFNESNNFNKENTRLAERLKEVLQSNNPNLLICLPHAFHSLSNDNKHAL
ncbi:hypothetical protein HMPREF0653_00250 [Prevotella disiens JCM 6334 = ATCC 29426]|uniref:Glycosyltransferase, SP_1767 family n=2 Tax=Prevotella disiens TaxID=28130 RepID=A0A379DZR8_9BACT|nr:GT-D fold domain-containing glycosyltransferase [Prevotella disiens]ERJ80799.1 hypothetical protein HMPREF0653_00250 [Prevotella disiens JCM 6334 = ATCC 29426]SUB85581.1 glycosyltransferase, SP_1767 family [Prevotella disiens]